jgi:hypothetical protein
LPRGVWRSTGQPGDGPGSGAPADVAGTGGACRWKRRPASPERCPVSPERRRVCEIGTPARTGPLVALSVLRARCFAKLAPRGRSVLWEGSPHRGTAAVMVLTSRTAGAGRAAAGDPWPDHACPGCGAQAEASRICSAAVTSRGSRSLPTPWTRTPNPVAGSADRLLRDPSTGFSPMAGSPGCLPRYTAEPRRVTRSGLATLNSGRA